MNTNQTQRSEESVEYGVSAVSPAEKKGTATPKDSREASRKDSQSTHGYALCDRYPSLLLRR